MKFKIILNSIEKKYKSLLDDMSSMLSNKRKKHVLGVVKMSYNLSKLYKEDQYKCMLASYFHDFFREENHENIFKLIKKYKIKINEYEKKNFKILHGVIASRFFLKENIIDIKKVLDAIRDHTTGNYKMNKISKILFISDAIEENRNYKDVDKLRDYVFLNSLNDSFFFILKKTIYTQLSKNYFISKKSLYAYNEIINKRSL